MNAPWQDRNLNPSLLPSKTTAKLLDPESFVKMEESQTFVAQTKKKSLGLNSDENRKHHNLPLL